MLCNGPLSDFLYWKKDLPLQFQILVYTAQKHTASPLQTLVDNVEASNAFFIMKVVLHNEYAVYFSLINCIYIQGPTEIPDDLATQL